MKQLAADKNKYQKLNIFILYLIMKTHSVLIVGRFL